MARHYTRDELLKLRESPLVAKPLTLPPAEEWMGPPLDANDAKNATRNARGLNRTKTEDGLATESVNNRRIPFDTRRKSTTAPEDIILGPPKTAFASASGRNVQRSTITNPDEDKTDKPRNNFRDRFSRDAQKADREDLGARDSKTGQPHHRRFKDEGDPWTKHNKPHGNDEREKNTRRNGDWDDLRERRDRGDGARGHGHKTYGENTNHDRRNGHWRSQDGPLWAQESTGEDGGKNHHDSRDRTSSGFNAHNRTWNRGQPLDEDPLWMEAEPAEEKKQGHTIDDFEEFRRQMKARDGKKVDNEQSAGTDTRSTPLSPRATSNNTKIKDKAFDFGGFNDAFLDSLSQPQKQNTAQSALHEASKQEVVEAAAKMAKASKFSNLFSAKPEVKEAILTQAKDDTLNEDRAGFQRILNLLGQQPQPQPQPQATPNQKTPPLASHNDMPQMSPPLQPPQARRHEESRQVQNGPSQPRNKESEFLLNLMQQPRQANLDHPRQNMPNRQEAGNGLSGPPFSSFLGSPHSEHPSPHQNGGPSHPSFFDEPARHDPPPPRQDRLNPSGPPLQRPAPPGISDFFAQRPGNNLPPGLERRPPGFDHMPPGYAGHAGPQPPQQQQQQQQRSMVPPPGFPPPQRPPTGHMPGPYGGRPNGPGGLPPPPPGFMMGGPPQSGPPLFGGFGQDGGPGFGNGGFEFGGPPGFVGPGGQRR